MSNRGAYSLAARFGAVTPCKRETGLTMAELECVIAVAAAEKVGAIATRESIQRVTKGGRGNLPSELVGMGMVVQLGRTAEKLAYYGLGVKGRELVGRLVGEGRA